MLTLEVGIFFTLFLMTQLNEILKKHLPPNAVSYCLKLWKEHPFEFKLAGKRLSKLGDYRFWPQNNRVQITVNRDLNPHQFLITYLHEVAHHMAYLKYGRGIKPHGSEWKNTFQKLLVDVLKLNCIPEELELAYLEYAANPTASTHSHMGLSSSLKSIDGEDTIRLKDMDSQTPFYFRNKRFMMLKKRRTRALCIEMSTKERYLIHLLAEVDPEE